MYILLQFIIVVVLFFSVGYLSWWFTEDKDIGHIPEFLNFRPFICRKCLTFWLLVGIYVALGISFELWVVLVAGAVLAILNAIAMTINEKNKTVKIENDNVYL